MMLVVLDGRASKAPAPINLEALRERASDGATALVQELGTTAKTEALLMMGERKQAFSLIGESGDFLTATWRVQSMGDDGRA